MSANAMPVSRLIPGDGLLPALIEQRLRKIKVDRFTGNVQLNIKDGCVLGFHVVEIVMLTSRD